MLGARPYDRIPAYMQHADVVIIPHLVNRFTESLDPIKAYECLAAGRPTVATPVAGFRELGPPIVTADRSRFVEATSTALAAAGPAGLPGRFDGRAHSDLARPGRGHGLVDGSGPRGGSTPVRTVLRRPLALRSPGRSPAPFTGRAGRGYCPRGPGRPILSARPTGSPKASDH